MPKTALAQFVELTDELLVVHLTDGRILSVPLIWFPILRAASPRQQRNVEVRAGGRGLHWPDLDEDLSLAGLLAGVDQEAA